MPDRMTVDHRRPWARMALVWVFLAVLMGFALVLVGRSSAVASPILSAAPAAEESPSPSPSSVIVTVSPTASASASASKAAAPAPAPTTQATGPAQDVTVLVKPVEPFVIGEPTQGTIPTGFSIDLWNAIAERSNYTTKWVWTDTVTNQINGVNDQQADVAVGAITMTPEREAKIDFSLRMFSSSLGIIAQSDTGQTSSFLSVIFTPQLAQALKVVLGAVIGFGIILYFVRRRQEDFPHGVVRGVGQSMWLSGQAVMGRKLDTVFTGGEAPTKFLGRVLYLIWLWIAILLAAYIGGAITSVMTVKQLQSGIAGPEDLANYKTVAPEGTTSDTYLTNLGIGHAVVPTYQDGLAGLETGRFEAMVFDRPVLQYWLQENAGSGLELVGGELEAEPYGFALQRQSPLRDEINLALLEINEDGTYDRIYEAWFGSTPQDGAG